MFRDKGTIEWLRERKSNLDKEIIKLEQEISKSDQKREVLNKKLDEGYFIDTLKFEINSYNIFCHKKLCAFLHAANWRIYSTLSQVFLYVF